MSKVRVYVPSRQKRGLVSSRPLADFRGDPRRQRWGCLVESLRSYFSEEISKFRKRFDVTYQAIQNWEKQGSLPEPERWHIMAKLLDLTVEQLEAYVNKGDPVVTEAIDQFLKTGKHDLAPTKLFEKNGDLNLKEVAQVLKDQPIPILIRLATVTTSILSGKTDEGEDPKAIA